MHYQAVTVSETAPTGRGTCDANHHRHMLELDDSGRPVVYLFPKDDYPVTAKQPVQPAIVFDGLCHDNDTEVPEIPAEERQILKPNATHPIT